VERRHLPRLELELDPLSETKTALLVEARLSGPVDSATARRLWSITQGNALYLRQLVDGELNRDGCIRSPGCGGGRVSWRCRRGWWSWCRPGSGGCRMLSEMEVLAFGEPLGVPLLMGLTDAVAVEQVEARRLVEAYPDGRRLQARLAHPLFGEVQRAQIAARSAAARSNRMRVGQHWWAAGR
jgi:hypothetical protein